MLAPSGIALEYPTRTANDVCVSLLTLTMGGGRLFRSGRAPSREHEPQVSTLSKEISILEKSWATISARERRKIVASEGVAGWGSGLTGGAPGSMAAAASVGPDPRRTGAYVVQGEMTMVVSCMRRNARWSAVEDDVQDPLLQGFAVLKQTLATVNGLPTHPLAGTCCTSLSHPLGYLSRFDLNLTSHLLFTDTITLTVYARLQSSIQT